MPEDKQKPVTVAELRTALTRLAKNVGDTKFAGGSDPLYKAFAAARTLLARPDAEPSDDRPGVLVGRYAFTAELDRLLYDLDAPDHLKINARNKVVDKLDTVLRAEYSEGVRRGHAEALDRAKRALAGL